MTDAEVFMFFMVVIGVGWHIGVRAREYVERRRYMAANSEAYVVASQALLKQHCDQLARAELHHIPTGPLRERMAKEDLELLAGFSQVSK